MLCMNPKCNGLISRDRAEAVGPKKVKTCCPACARAFRLWLQKEAQKKRRRNQRKVSTINLDG